MASVILWIPWSGIDNNDTTISRAEWAEQPTPSMTFGELYPPSELLHKLDGVFDMLIGMPGPTHPLDYTVLFTFVKQR